MIFIDVFSVIVATVVLGTYECGAVQNGCSLPDERCVPIRHCPKEFDSIKTGEFLRNATINKHVKSKICNPIERAEKKKHICCDRSQIECQLNGKKGACLLREECPLLQLITEQELMESAEMSLCYVHDTKKHFCCTDPYCVQHKRLCEHKEVKSATSGHSTLYPECSHGNGIKGSLVPKALCGDRSRSFKRSVEQHVCCLPPDNPHQLMRHSNAEKLANVQCGTTGYHNKIQNGENAQHGEFPWMAYLVYKSRRICSGTLIHPSYVLTARHCARHNPVGVRLGVHNVLKIAEQEQQIGVEKRISSNTHDVGLLRLAKPAALDEHLVQPICLPVYESLRMYLPSTVTITGWGATEKGRLSYVLMKADTQVLINETECAMDNICTGGRKHNNHCNGDSGGPYQALSTYGDKTRFVQYGVISDGPAYCSYPDRPSRGVLVAYVMNWILDNMVL